MSLHTPNNPSSPPPLEILQKYQADVSSAIGDFLKSTDFPIAELMEYLYIIKEQYVENAKHSSSSEDLSTLLSERNLIPIETILLQQAKDEYGFDIPTTSLYFRTVERKLKAMKEQKLSCPPPPISTGYELYAFEDISGVILPPDADKMPIIGSGAGRESAEKNKYFDKLGAMHEIIASNSNIELVGSWKKGIVDTDSMRKLSYVVGHLRIAGSNNKTIYINNLYGQASYIALGHLNNTELTTYTKNDHKAVGQTDIAFYGYERIDDPMHKSTHGILNWKKTMIEYLLADSQVEKTPPTEAEQIKDYFLNYPGGYEKLMNLTTKEIGKLEIKGNKTNALASKAGFISKYELNTRTPTGFQEFISWIYNKSFEYEAKEELSAEEIRERFKDYPGGFEQLMNLSAKEIGKIEIGGNKTNALASKVGFTSKSGFRVDIPTGFQEFISWIYGKPFEYEANEKQDLSAEEILERFKDYPGGFEKLMNLTAKEIEKLEIKGNKIISLASKVGFTSKFGLQIQTLLGFQEFISWIYGKPFEYEANEKEELSAKEVIERFKDYPGGFEQLMNFTAKEIKKLEIKGNKIMSLATKAGFRSQYGLNIQTPIGFREFVAWVYGIEFIVEKKEDIAEEIKQYFINYAGGYDSLIQLNEKQILQIEYKGNKIVYLKTKSGFTSQHGLNIQTLLGFEEFVAWVYGKPFEYKQNKKEELSAEKIKELFKNYPGGYETLMNLTAKEIRKFEIKGNKTHALASKAGFISKSGFRIDIPTGFQEFISWIYEKPFVNSNQNNSV